MSRSLPGMPRPWANSRAQHKAGKGRSVLSWFEVWEKPDETRAGGEAGGPQRAPGEQHCPAALRKPISERARSRWPKQTGATVAAGGGRREGSETRVKAIGSGSASSRLDSQKPVDRPVS